MITTYPKINITIKPKNPNDIYYVYNEAVRAALTADGLLDAPIAHGHISPDQVRKERATILFRKGYKCLEVLGIGKEAIAYLTEQLPRLMMTPIHIKDAKNRIITIEQPMVSVQQGIDYVELGSGFHKYKTLEFILLSKADRQAFDHIMKAKDDKEKVAELAAKNIARNVAHFVADREGVKLRDVPRVFVSLNAKDIRVSAGRLKHTSYIQFSGEFGMNANLSGGKHGIGIGLLQSHGFGHIAKVAIA